MFSPCDRQSVMQQNSIEKLQKTEIYKKFELMLTRRAKAYSSSGLVV